MPHYPAWRTDEPYRGVWRREESLRGVGVHRRRHYVPPRQSALRRAAFEASFLVHGLLAPPPGRPDAVVSQMPSLADGVIGARIARRHRVPHVPVVQDLMGAAAAQSGIRGGGRAASAASAAERYALGGAALVGVIHESFVPGVKALGVDAGRIRWCPTGRTCELLRGTGPPPGPGSAGVRAPPCCCTPATWGSNRGSTSSSGSPGWPPTSGSC
ncbi:hypothetical protein GCM10020227_58060 [Streptomyces flavovirens]